MKKQAYWEIGLRIKKVREALGISQMKLAEAIGVSFQQIQKYESGINKVSIDKLKKISEALNAPMTYFIGIERKRGKKELVAGKGAIYCDIGWEELSSDEIKLLLLFRGIKNKSIKEGLYLLLKGVDEAERAERSLKGNP